MTVLVLITLVQHYLEGPATMKITNRHLWVGEWMKIFGIQGTSHGHVTFRRGFCRHMLLKGDNMDIMERKNKTGCNPLLQ